MRRLLLFIVVLLCMFGCDMPEQTARETPTPTPVLSQASTPVPTIEPTQEVIFTIPSSTGSNLSLNAAVGGYWVSSGGGPLRSVPLNQPDAEPVILDEQSIFAFNVWGEYVAAYAKPDANTPYRIVLYKPDGSGGKIVIPFRQSEFINPKWTDGDYCYSHEAGMIRRLTLSTMILEDMFPVPEHNVYGVVNGMIAAFDFNTDTLRFYPLNENGNSRDMRFDFDIMQVTLCDGGVMLNDRTQGCFVDGDMVAHELGGAVWACEIFSFCPQYIVMERSEQDALGNYYPYFLIGAQGVYPLDALDGLAPTGEGMDGAATVGGVNPEQLIPLTDFPMAPTPET